MTFEQRVYAGARALDCRVNGLLLGNPKQTLSARGYEAAILRHRWDWVPFYYGWNGVMYVVRWSLNRVAGWNIRMPRNHCMDAFLAHPDVTTYGAR